jgi:hypothetical protein
VKREVPDIIRSRIAQERKRIRDAGAMPLESDRLPAHDVSEEEIQVFERIREKWIRMERIGHRGEGHCWEKVGETGHYRCKDKFCSALGSREYLERRRSKGAKDNFKVLE